MTRQDDNLAHESLQAEEINELNLNELCSICHVTPDFVMELIAYGALEPIGRVNASMRTLHFDAREVHIIHTALHLHHDLEVNHAGIALAIDLLKQIEELRWRLTLLEKHF